MCRLFVVVVFVVVVVVVVGISVLLCGLLFFCFYSHYMSTHLVIDNNTYNHAPTHALSILFVHYCFS